MFRLRKSKNTENIKITQEEISIDESRYDIYLEKIFYIMKYGDVINLDIKKTDIYEYDEFLALGRILILDGIEISIGQWADWTISIKLIDGNENLIVAECLIPNERINWDNKEKFVVGNPKMNWVQKGSWQKIISEKINDLYTSIRSAIKQIELEKEKKIKLELLNEENKNKQKRKYFEEIYKNK